MKKILLVDDDQDFLFATAELLTTRGFSVFTADSVKLALEMLVNHHIDVVVSDIIIPEHDGFELIMKIKKTNPSIKIIAISGGGKIDKQTYLQMAQGIQADATIAKPFRIEELVSTINSLT